MLDSPKPPGDASGTMVSQVVPQPEKAPAAPLQLVPTTEDREFLPAALEILETPPSPIRIKLIVVMATFVAVALLWAFFGRLDVIAIAQGKVQPPGRVKIVQSAEPGKVLRINVQNGDRIQRDSILVEFDPADARADREALDAGVSALKAEIARRDTAVRAVTGQGKINTDGPAILWPEGIPESTRAREAAVMRADLLQLSATIGSLEAQRVQKQRERQRLKETLLAQDTLVKTLRERVTMRSTLVTSGFGTRAAVIDSKETLQKEETTLTSLKGQIEETEAALLVNDQERARYFQTFMAENTQKRADAQRLLDETTQRLAKAATRLDNMTLRAPSDGVVQALTLFTQGQVVPAGQEVMRIVPESATMEVEAYIPNKDIGFVRQGQDVSIKVDSFPFTRYGMLSGKVSRVAQDAIPLPEAAQVEQNPARPGDSQFFGGAQRTQNLVFPVTITLDQPGFVIGEQKVSITPGMTVVAEIKTGSRRILEYVFSPVYEVTSESMRER